eukprot:CAMPEP_0170467466 /NCGR_PEP_ID=MMETSP0123-20130129/11035_1 /TAXON_ID=182087 /ORGANISM="Favella ehrenbergii, Strain Fehren 1" /LENGTH=98 /DNA_ID=CAMNT_0010733841 /DNA_START=23 /DNA_END=319 /DNA_ORIENTATION=-
MVESASQSKAAGSASAKERTPAETAELMKRLYKMPYEIITNESALLHSDHSSLFKVIIIGDSGVGKSCLMHRVTTNEFKIDHEVTVGVEFGTLVIKLE